jgi:hypothetical protein
LAKRVISSGIQPQLRHVLLTIILVTLFTTARPTYATSVNLLIRPGKSVGLVQLGMQSAQVKRVWGSPSSIRQPQPGYELWLYDRLLSTVHVQGNEVTQVQTSSPVFRSARGVGPGSPRAVLLEAYGKPTWADNMGPVVVYTYARLGLVATFRGDDQSFVAALSVLRAPITR